MDVTLYKYVTGGARWDGGALVEADYQAVVRDMNGLPLQGYDYDRKYGFAQCGFGIDVVYGLFVQKFPTKLIDYDSETKNETVQSAVDSGEYLFILFPKTYELYLQTKRSSDLPNQDEIIRRFIAVAALANQNNKFLFTDLQLTTDQINRDKIIEIFYEKADSITELELEDFDPAIINEQESQRGRIQTYFNPYEEYQEALKEAGLRFAGDTKRVNVKAKQGSSFKKDPIARAMLEGSRKPIKIVYQKDSETKTEYGVTKSKEVITIEATEFDLENQIENIVNRIRSGDQSRSRAGSNEAESQNRLF